MCMCLNNNYCCVSISVNNLHVGVQGCGERQLCDLEAYAGHPLDWYSISACYKQEQHPLLIKSEPMNNLPEVLDCDVCLAVSFIDCYPLENFHIHLGTATNEHFNLLRSKQLVNLEGNGDNAE